MSFGTYFKELRKAKQATQKEIADALGKSTMLVSGVETSKNGPFTEADLEIVSMVLELSDNEKKQLFIEAAKARGKLPLYLLDYINGHNEAYILLDVLAQKELGNESLSKIVEYVEENS